jgi:hypothetical protein
MNAHIARTGVTLSVQNKGVGVQRHAPCAVPWQSDPVHSTQKGWAGHGDALDKYEKFPHHSIKSRTVQPLASCNTDYTIPATD